VCCPFGFRRDGVIRTARLVWSNGVVRLRPTGVCRFELTRPIAARIRCWYVVVFG
jgi:hypothetical protein